MTSVAAWSRRTSPDLLKTARYRIRKGDINCLWAGQTVSMFGDEITAVALPTVALLLLNVSPLQFGLVGASSYLPYPVLGLLAGAWIDRVRRRIVLLIADLVRGAAIASVPVAVLTRTVTLTQLVIVGLIVGTASVFFNSAYQAYLPHLVATDDLNKANARLSISETASQVAGPTMAGGLISLAGVAGAMFTDAMSFLASVVSLMFIRRPEPKPERRRGSLIPEVRQGLRLVISNRLLLGLTLTSAVSNLGRGMALELVVFFAFRGLHLSPALVGIMMAAGNAGPFLGSLASQRFTARFGIGPALLTGSVMKGLPWVFMPLALLGDGVPVVITVMVVSGFFIPISNVTTLTIRQTLVSSDMQGRVAATVRTVTRTVVPLATILGGALAQFGTRLLGPRAGLTAVLALGGLIWLSAGLLLPRRTLRRVHSIGDLENAMPTNDEQHSGTAPSRRARAARRALQQSLLISQEPALWADELYRPMRAMRPAGYGSWVEPGARPHAAAPPPASPWHAGPRMPGPPALRPPASRPPTVQPPANGTRGNGNQPRPMPYPRPAAPRPASPWPADPRQASPWPAGPGQASPRIAAQPAARQPANGIRRAGNQPRPGPYPQPAAPQPGNPWPTHPRQTNPQPAPRPASPWPADLRQTTPQPAAPPPGNPWPTDPRQTHPQPAAPRPGNPWPTHPRPTSSWPAAPRVPGQPVPRPAADEVRSGAPGQHPAATGRTAPGRRGTGRP